jgi:hypothetical protein
MLYFRTRRKQFTNSTRSEKFELFVTQKFVTSFSISTHDLWNHYHLIFFVLRIAHQRLLSWYSLQRNRILWWSNSTNERMMIQRIKFFFDVWTTYWWFRRQNVSRNVQIDDKKYREMCDMKTFQYVISKHLNIKSIWCETQKFDNCRMQRIF